MKCLALISILFACATWTGVHALAAAGQPAVAGSIPPLPTLSTPAREGASRMAEGESAAGPLHDPTQPSAIMRQLIGPAKLPGHAKAPEIPIVEVKARIICGEHPGVAVLVIDKQTYVVCKGSEFTVAGAKYGGQRIRVVELDADVVRFEIQPTNLSVTLR
ncbi:MAG: hypothetical protein ABSG53_29555 [Thermoguttaceae bacterium]